MNTLPALLAKPLCPISKKFTTFLAFEALLKVSCHKNVSSERTQKNSES